MAMRRCGSSLLRMPYYSLRSIFVQSSKKMGTDSAATAGKQKITDANVPSWCSEILMCPLSRKPLRRSIGPSNGGEEGSEDSLLSDAYPCISYPIVDGIPCLIPSQGKLLKTNDNDGDDKASMPADSTF
ncbi:uncharacterized protein LOC113357196 [Papaver somniferum]|uniref:uncharacterized protein LOC113357196 n=1 Tax=Papaver somniferum TaxID=3469 RepID=UPI000E6FD385|nr:uncharacterized protein LOC113357196 [Papaver somniferum]